MLLLGLFYIWNFLGGFGSPMWVYKSKLPNWHQSPLGGPIMPQISPNSHELLTGHGWSDVGQLLHLGMHGCGNVGGLESQGGIKCTKSRQKWTKSTSSAPSQPRCPNSMNGSIPAMMRVHMWLFYWAGLLMCMRMPQFDLAFVQLSTPSPPHSVLMQKCNKID